MLLQKNTNLSELSFHKDHCHFQQKQHVSLNDCSSKFLWLQTSTKETIHD